MAKAEVGRRTMVIADFSGNRFDCGQVVSIDVTKKGFKIALTKGDEGYWLLIGLTDQSCRLALMYIPEQALIIYRIYAHLSVTDDTLENIEKMILDACNKLN